MENQIQNIEWNRCNFISYVLFCDQDKYCPHHFKNKKINKRSGKHYFNVKTLLHIYPV
jgi:hypothetical protein